MIILTSGEPIRRNSADYDYRVLQRSRWSGLLFAEHCNVCLCVMAVVCSSCVLFAWLGVGVLARIGAMMEK